MAVLTRMAGRNQRTEREGERAAGKRYAVVSDSFTRPEIRCARPILFFGPIDCHQEIKSRFLFRFFLHFEFRARKKKNYNLVG